MRSKVILCCAVALCLEIVASLPYSIDLQRYSGYKTRPAVESSYQSNAPRPYTYSNKRNDGVYRTPTIQLQEQQLPKMERDNHFARNQQRYLPKGPPQVEVFNGKYSNQQNNPSEYFANRQMNKNRPVEVQNIREAPVQSLNQITNTEPFIPAIPSVPEIPAVPVRFTYPNAPLRRISDDTHHIEIPKVQEIELPIIQTPSPRVESVPEVENLDRLLARASDPVEQIPEPRKPQRLSIEQYLSHPKIKEVLSTTKHQKRYLVIHPDGTVEHVDKLESVAEKHPNYFLVKAGEIGNRLNRKPVATAPPLSHPSWPQTQPSRGNDKILIPATPYNAVAEVPVEKTATVETGAIKEPRPIPIEPVKENPATVVPEPIVQEPLTIPPPVIPSVAEITTTESIPKTKRPIQPSEINIEKEVLPPHDDKVANSPVEVELSVPAILAEDAPVNNEALTIVRHSEDITDEATIAPPTIAVSPVAPQSETITTEPLEPLTTQAKGIVPPEAITEASLAPAPQEIQDSPTPQAVVEALTTNPSADNSVPKDLIMNEDKEEESPIPPEVPEQPEDNVTPEVLEKSQEEPATPKSPVENTIPTDENHNENSTPIITVAESQSPMNKTDDETVTPSEPAKEINKIDEYMLEEASKCTPSPEVVVPNFGDLDISKVRHKPAIWFRTSEPNFWDKLADKDKGLDVVYFFQIHNQPKIEKDVKTTIHPNGTIVEDTVETIWAFEGDEPIIAKSTKVIHPEDM